MSKSFLRMRLVAMLTVAASLVLSSSAEGHEHPPPTCTDPTPPPFCSVSPPGAGLNAGGAGASWRHLKVLFTGNPQSDLDYFTSSGEIYAGVGELAMGSPLTGGGVTIVRLTQNGEVTETSPAVVARHPSGYCGSDPNAAFALQHDIEAVPKGDVLFNTSVPAADRSDAQLLLDATDGRPRCHDAAADARGGLEIIDITHPSSPYEIGLTSHIGEAHTVNVDPKRPHIAFVSPSDSLFAQCNSDDTACTRPNETNPAMFALDGFELVDLRTCMNFGLPMPTEETKAIKRAMCRPEVYRYRWPNALMALGHSFDDVAGCHELEIDPNDLLTCATWNATMVFDLKGAFNDNSTPNNFLDDTPNGSPLPCRVRESSSPQAPLKTRAMATDCVVGENGVDLKVANWLKPVAQGGLGAPSLEGVAYVGSVIHQGRVRGNPLPPPAYETSQDVYVSHEAEFTHSGKHILVTDERSGDCFVVDNGTGNAGLHAYKANALLTASPPGVDPPATSPPPPGGSPQAQAAWTSYAQKPGGGKAIHRVPVRTPEPVEGCSAHVFHQIPGQNRIFMAWYSQGTQVIDYVEHSDGTFEFKDAGWFIPENANSWTSAVFKMRNNGDGTFTYWGATGDWVFTQAGRNAIDVYEVTLPAPALAPTAVNLRVFSARRAGRSIELRWRTAQETELLGFNVYRSRGGRAIKLNRGLIPAKAGGAPVGGRYRLLDRSARHGVVYTYRLQAVELDGKRYRIGMSRLRF